LYLFEFEVVEVRFRRSLLSKLFNLDSNLACVSQLADNVLRWLGQKILGANHLCVFLFNLHSFTAKIYSLCEEIEQWLTADRANVVSIHCKAGTMGKPCSIHTDVPLVFGIDFLNLYFDYIVLMLWDSLH